MERKTTHLKSSKPHLKGVRETGYFFTIFQYSSLDINALVKWCSRIAIPSQKKVVFWFSKNSSSANMTSLCNILICRCMQKHIQHNKDERKQFFWKIYLSLYSKGFERVTKGFICERWVGDWTELQHIDLPTLLAIAAFLFRSPGSHSSIFFPTNWLPVTPGLYNCLTPTCFLWASHLHSIQPVNSQGYPLISSTRCTCYLHRYISYFDSSVGANI